MRCGNCTGSHAHAHEVRSCYGLGQTIPATVQPVINTERLAAFAAHKPNRLVAGARALGRTIRTRCERCAGTGQFITGSMNGVPTGPGGPCFRCAGKGYQTDADERRNYGYDNFAPIRY